MRRINIKEFHQNMWKELKDLPLEVTRYGKPYVVIYPLDAKITEQNKTIEERLKENGRS